MGRTVSVLVATINRPEYVRKCIEHLLAQEPRPDQIMVVDASEDDRTKNVVAEYPGVEYLENPGGRGNLPNSRNAGLKYATGEIISFVDDDAFAHPAWLSNLLETYDEPNVGAVGGRALDNRPNEENTGVDSIGKLKPNGQLCGFFAAHPGKIIEVDHMLGANMSYRREVLAKLGGFRDDIPTGPSGVCEDTDMCLRVRQSGYRILFNPFATVDHIAAPQFSGRRFDHRWEYFIRRNQFIMYIRTYGFNGLVARYSVFSIVSTLRDFIRRIYLAFVYFGVNVAGFVMGIFYGFRLLLKQHKDPVRYNGDAELIRQHLSTPPLKKDAPESD